MRRSLTVGETALARHIFGDAIDYTAVRLVFGAWWQFKSRTAIAPRGTIYFPAFVRNDDFSCADATLQMWFMHEITHVWQYQRGFAVLASGACMACCGGYYQARAYRYLQDAYIIAPFQQLNMEQQAEVVAHYFAAEVLHIAQYQPRRAALAHCIRPLLNHPTWLVLLPKFGM